MDSVFAIKFLKVIHLQYGKHIPYILIGIQQITYAIIIIIYYI